MAKYLFLLGHGGSDTGAIGSGTNERDFLRRELLPHLLEWAKLSKHTVTVYTENSFVNKYLNQISTDWNVCELHLDSAGVVGHGGHVIIHGNYQPDDMDNRLASVLKRHFGCRGGRCFDGRFDLQQPNIASYRKINYRLVELCFINNAQHMAYFRQNLSVIAKELIEAMTGETLVKPVPVTPKPTPTQPPATPQTGTWATKVKGDLIRSGIMSDGDWNKSVTKEQVASWMYTAKQKGWFK